MGVLIKDIDAAMVEQSSQQTTWISDAQSGILQVIRRCTQIEPALAYQLIRLALLSSGSNPYVFRKSPK